MRVVHFSTIHRALDVRIFVKECRTLAKAGYEVHLIIQDPPSTCIDSVIFHALRVPVKGGRLSRLFARTIDVWRQSIALKGDIYHFHDPELIVLGLWLKLTGAKVIYDVHEDSPREAIALNPMSPLLGRFKAAVWTALEALASIFLDGFVCVTPEIASRFPPNKTVLVHNFPLTAELEKCVENSLVYSDRSPNVVYAGGLTPIRGIAEIIQAVGLVSAEVNAKLVLLGEFSPIEWQAQLAQMPGWKQVEYLGWRSRSEVLHQLGRARAGLVVLHPVQIYIESIPNKLFEYMAAGLPVIASDFPRWRQLITDLECGVVVDPLSTEMITTAMQALLDDPVTAEKMGQNGQRAVREHFNWEVDAQKLLILYDSLAGARQ